MKCSSNLFLTGILVFVVFFSQQVFGQNQNCRGKGETCLTNRDCCSSRCLPIAQVCLRSVEEAQQEIVQGYNNGQTPFWDIPGGKKYETVDGLLASIYETDDGSPQEQIFTIPFVGTQTRFGDVDSVPITKASQGCLAIGKKCFRNEVCCSTRCHGFLNQCVT